MPEAIDGIGVEPVARAIATARGLDWERLAENKLVHAHAHSPLTVTRECIRAEARDAIEAHKAALATAGYVIRPRVPTEAMLIGARDWSLRKNGQGVGNDQAAGCWEAMVDAEPD